MRAEGITYRRLRGRSLLAFLLLAAALLAAGCSDNPSDSIDQMLPAINTQSLELDFDEDTPFETTISGIVSNGTLEDVELVGGAELIAAFTFDAGQLRLEPMGPTPWNLRRATKRGPRQLRPADAYTR